MSQPTLDVRRARCNSDSFSLTNMTPEFRRRVEDLYHAALARDERDRVAFVRLACVDDEALGREVESLLAQRASADDFLDGPAVALAAHLISDAGATMLTGRRLGAYQLQGLIGAGGMGEVYRARDTKLGRDVAIKVLPRAFSSNPERLARFEREARVLAALNHPHIGAIHGLEESDGIHALVLELVEGETLADRIQRGPLPLKEALTIGRQIADALEAAHEKGIIHRDLKPANVKITPDGGVKVLDFGLATVAAADGSAANLTQAPTVTVGATREGAILGTAAYMSPEQARGEMVDRRTDIWAFGCVLYEMLAGKRPFQGKATADLISAILTRDPEMDAVPISVRLLVEKCLRKDSRRRWQAIGDVRLAIEEGPAAGPAPAEARPARMAWAIAAAVTVALAVLAAAYFRQSPPELQAIRFGVPIPGGSGPDAVFALSPDGRNLAITASQDGRRNLWVRPIGALEVRLIPNTDGAIHPFWSPDSTQIAFVAEGSLKKVSITGGSPTTLAQNVTSSGSWNREGSIIFTGSPSSSNSLARGGQSVYRVDQAGGAAIPLLTVGTAVPSHPQFLPGGRTFLFTQENLGVGRENQGIFVGSMDGSAPVRLLPDFSRALYSPPVSGAGPGHLLFRRDGLLMAQRFDAETLALSGSAVRVTEEPVIYAGTYGSNTSFSLSDTGVLAFQSEANEQLAWVDRAGVIQELLGPPGEYRDFRLSPDQTRIAMEITRYGAGTSPREVAWFDLRRGVLDRLTFDEDADLIPVWSSDGQRIAFSSRRLGNFYPYVTGGPNKETLLAKLETGGGWPVDWSPDGRFVLWQGTDLWVVPVTAGEMPFRYIQSPFSERGGQFSPDGRWIAYSSDESGRDNVYVQSFPAGRRFTVSGRGGSEPAWRRDGRELFYVAADGSLTAVPLTLGEASIEFGQPQSLFTAPAGTFRRNYDVSIDGQRFLIASPARPGGAAITVVLNWQAGLEK